MDLTHDSFAAFKAALLTEHKAADPMKTGESTTLLLALLKLKEVNREVSTRALEAQEACAREKERAECEHLRLENLLYKRSHLLTEIAQSQDLSTPYTDAIVKETSKPLATRKYTKDLRAKHEQVLTLMMREQMDRKADKLALEQLRKEYDAQLAALDNKRRFVDEEMQKYIMKLSEAVQAAAQEFQRLDS